ncbi:MAG TPA: hypothetical protein VKB59_21970 [Micromonosporaceae bacterium]|nr:hypothetical protein [Micromonosporaceae bacterium]
MTTNPGTVPKPGAAAKPGTPSKAAAVPRPAILSRSRVRMVAVLAVSLLLAFVAVTARVFVWPDLGALPTRASAIVELGGQNDDGRDSVALQLAKAHRAAYLVQSTTVTDTTNCLPAVPGVTVLCFHANPATTRGEAEWIGQTASRLGWTSVILVTTPDQAWRARLRVSRCFPGPVFVATAPLPTLAWFTQIPYQWAASIKALTVQRGC